MHDYFHKIPRARFELAFLHLRACVHLFDTGRMDRPLNYEMPSPVPRRPMGDVLVIARLVWPDGEEWRPVRANRWTKTHVMIEWDDHICWLRAEDVTRVLRRDPT